MAWKCNPNSIRACLTCQLPDCKYVKPSGKSYNRTAYYKEHKAAAEATGMCSRCWKRPATAGYKTCAACREGNRKKMNLYYKEKAHGGGNRRERKVKHSTESITRNEGKANVS